MERRSWIEEVIGLRQRASMWQYVFDLFKGGCCILRFSSPSFHWHWCDVIYNYSRQCVNKYTFDSLACMYIFIDIWLCICSRAHAYLHLRMVHVLRKCLLHIYIMIWIRCLPWPSASMPQSRTAQHLKRCVTVSGPDEETNAKKSADNISHKAWK